MSEIQDFLDHLTLRDFHEAGIFLQREIDEREQQARLLAARANVLTPGMAHRSETLIFTVTDDQWVATLGADNAITTNPAMGLLGGLGCALATGTTDNLLGNMLRGAAPGLSGVLKKSMPHF